MDSNSSLNLDLTSSKLERTIMQPKMEKKLQLRSKTASSITDSFLRGQTKTLIPQICFSLIQ